MLTVVNAVGTTSNGSLIDEIVREGARRMLAEAFRAEVDAYIAQFADQRDERGRRLVVRNGSHQPREVLTSAGAIELKAPRVNDRRTDPETGERRRFSSAILPPWARKTPKVTEVLPLLYLHGLSSGDFVPALGQFLGSSAGLSSSVITKLTEQSAHPAAKKHLAEIWNAEDETHALAAVKAFEAAYGAKYPKAVAKVTNELPTLIEFYAYPAEHWQHLRTTNPIESTFATVRHRTKVTKGPGSRAAGLAMAFKLIESAQARWRAINAPHLVALVRAGARFERGVLVEREPATAA
ncbi:transposase [Sphaerisporangium viridialbum]|uniref:transposase n=1 Tax=Sphaerisporangium viridialbum TaxID=46189 RepID=UPI003C76C013